MKKCVKVWQKHGNERVIIWGSDYMNGEKTNTSCSKCKYYSDYPNCVWGIIRLHEIDYYDEFGAMHLRANKCEQFEEGVYKSRC